jgi:hypothetical protein
MIIERRRYHIERGRMDEMHGRMRDMLLPLFAVHNIPRPIAIWEDPEGSSVLTWFIEWPSFEDRQSRWAAFYPFFYAERAKQNIKEFVTRTDLTLIAPWPGQSFEFPASSESCESCWHPEPPIGQGAAFRAAMSDVGAKFFVDAGVSAVCASDLIFGPLPKGMIVLSWPDPKTRDRGVEQLKALPAPNDLARSVGLTGGSIFDHGLWEQFDRALYLDSWKFFKTYR